MLRLLTAPHFSAAAFRLVKEQVNRGCLPQRLIYVQSAHFFTKSPHRKDVPLPDPRESDGSDAIDLDKWKTVMRLKSVAEEVKQVGAEDDNDDSESNLTFEATRELVTMWRYAGKLVPQEINDDELKILSELSTKSARKKYLKYLAIREGHKMFRKVKQQKRKAERQAMLEQKREEEGEEDDDSKVMKSSFILQFWNRSLDRLLAWRCAQSMIFGQPLVFDLSYEGNMSKREIENTVSQLIEVEAWNRRATDPYHLHFCNLQPDSYQQQMLNKRYGAEVWDRLLVTNTNKQHFEVFPRERLVYLTADSPNVLRTYDHDKVYIVGGLVDRSIQSGLSLANAKRLKLATARLPLDEFLDWEIGAKNLTLDQMFRIMLTIKDTGEWKEALRFVPTRKHDGFHLHKQKTVTEQKTLNSGNGSLKDLKLYGFKQQPAFTRPKTATSKTTPTKQATNRRKWWNQE